MFIFSIQSIIRYPKIVLSVLVLTVVVVTTPTQLLAQVNRPVRFTSPSAFTHPENSGTINGRVLAEDPDTGDTINEFYSTTGPDGALFQSVEHDFGDLSFSNPSPTEPDFENPRDVGGNNVYDIIVTATSSDGTTATQAITITVTNVDEPPTFSAGTIIPNQTYMQNTAIEMLRLPAATGGDGTLTYTLTPAIPGLTLDLSTGELSGAPTTAATITEYTYTAHDADENEAASDAAILTFSITVTEDIAPDFGMESIADQTFFVGTPVNLTLPGVTPGTGNISIHYTLTPDLPAGLDFNAAERPAPTITSTPTAAAAMTEYTYTATDGDGNTDTSDTDMLTFSITVQTNTAPAFADGASIANQNYFTDTAIESLTLPQATGGEGAITYTLTPAIPGLTLDSSTGELTGTPTTAAAATMYTYTANDGDADMTGDDIATLTFSITVTANSAPDFGMQTIADQAFLVSTPVNLTLPVVTDGSGDIRIDYVLTPPPPAGLEFNAAPHPPTLTGMPTAAAAITEYTYTATDGDDNIADTDADMLTFSITVDIVPVFTNMGMFATAISVAENTAAVGTAGFFATTGSGTIALTPGGTDAARFSITDGGTLTFNDAPDFEMPRGIALSGTNTNDYALTVTAMNSVGSAESGLITVTVTDVNDAPVLNAIPTPTFTEHIAGGFTITATDEDAGQMLTFTLTGETHGTTLTAAGVFSWTPGEADGGVERMFTVTVTDDGTPMMMASTTFAITAEEDDTAPTFASDASIPDQSYVEGTAITLLTLPEATGGNGTITYSLSPPAGLTFDAAPRELSGTPTAAAGATDYTYMATDADDNMAADDAATLTFTITVSPMVTGIDDLTDRTFNIYPNPVSGSLTVERKGIAGDEISIHDFTGKRIQVPVREQSPRKVVLDVSGLAGGMYLVKVGRLKAGDSNGVRVLIK